MERLRDSLHFIDQDEDNEEEDEEEAPTKKSNHVVFVDSQDEGMGCMCIRFDCMLIPFLMYSQKVRSCQASRHST